MSKIYVNGYVLPTLPVECGSTEYPYFYMALSGSHFYLFALSAQGSINVEDPLLYQIPEDITVKYIMWVTAYNDSKIEELQESYPGITATDWMLEPTLNGSYSNTFPTNGKIKWSNHDIPYSDGTPYITGSTSTDLDLICGDDAIWDYDNDDTLIISGTGSTYDYSYQEENYPWSLLKENIKYIKINEGISRLGNANFHGLTKLSSVSTSNLPASSLIEIGVRCFGGCYNLSSIFLPDSVEKIDAFALAQCAFSSFWIPANLKELGSSVFVATSLHNIYLNGGNNDYFTISNGALFNKDLTTIIILPQKSSYTSYTIPDSVTKIADSCFYGHNNLKEIICPSTLTEIGYAAFSHIDNLMNIIIPANVNKIDNVTFQNNNKLQWIKFLSSTPCAISETAIKLNTCPNLTRIYVPAGCAEAYKSSEDWYTYNHLIYESQSIDFNLNQWMAGFVYGLTGQPLPLPVEKLALEVLNGNVLHIIKANNIITNPRIVEVR